MSQCMLVLPGSARVRLPRLVSVCPRLSVAVCACSMVSFLAGQSMSLTTSAASVQLYFPFSSTRPAAGAILTNWASCCFSPPRFLPAPRCHRCSPRGRATLLQRPPRRSPPVHARLLLVARKCAGLMCRVRAPVPPVLAMSGPRSLQPPAPVPSSSFPALVRHAAFLLPWLPAGVRRADVPRPCTRATRALFFPLLPSCCAGPQHLASC